MVLRDAAVARLGVAEDALEPEERPFDAAPDGGLGELDASVEVEIGLSLLGERALLVFNELLVLAHRARLGRDEPLLRVEIELSDFLALEAPRVARVDEDPLRFLPREHVTKASDVVKGRRSKASVSSGAFFLFRSRRRAGARARNDVQPS